MKLANTNKSLIITVIYLNSYDDANLIAKVNFTKEIRWGQNGLIMYLVESTDKDEIANVMGVFAGRE